MEFKLLLDCLGRDLSDVYTTEVSRCRNITIHVKNNKQVIFL